MPHRASSLELLPYRTTRPLFPKAGGRSVPARTTACRPERACRGRSRDARFRRGKQKRGLLESLATRRRGRRALRAVRGARAEPRSVNRRSYPAPSRAAVDSQRVRPARSACPTARYAGGLPDPREGRWLTGGRPRRISRAELRPGVSPEDETPPSEGRAERGKDGAGKYVKEIRGVGTGDVGADR